MEKPFLTLTSKDFLTGISPSAFTERGGIFLSTAGVTPIYNPGGTADTKNGVLQGSVTATDQSGSVIVDTIIAGDTGLKSGDTITSLFMVGTAGHIYQLKGGSNTPVDLHTAAVNGANGLAVWAPKAASSKLLYYFQLTQIGTWNLNATYSDAVYTGLTSSALHPTHQFIGNIYYGNVSKIGAIKDDGSATPVHTLSALSLPLQYTVSALSDDGTYLVIAATENPNGYAMFSNNKIFFWDAASSAVSWTREHDIRDPFIYALKRMGGAVYAFGQYGIYEVTFSGVKKIFARKIGFATALDFAAGYGSNRAIVYNGTSLLFGTDETIDSYGKLSPELPTAYFQALKNGGTNVASFLSASLDSGRVILGTKNNKLYTYDFNDNSNEVSSAQTVYFQLPTRMAVKRIDVTFGAPLVSGDSFSITTKVDAVGAAVTFGSATFAADGAIYRKSMYPTKPVRAENLSLYFVFNAGSVKVKKVELYGTPETP